MMSFSAISKIVGEVYDVHDIVVSMGVTIFLISFILFTFLTVPTIEKLGLKWTFRIAAAGTILGAWGKWIGA